MPVGGDWAPTFELKNKAGGVSQVGAAGGPGSSRCTGSAGYPARTVCHPSGYRSGPPLSRTPFSKDTKVFANDSASLSKSTDVPDGTCEVCSAHFHIFFEVPNPRTADPTN